MLQPEPIHKAKQVVMSQAGSTGELSFVRNFSQQSSDFLRKVLNHVSVEDTPGLLMKGSMNINMSVSLSLFFLLSPNNLA